MFRSKENKKACCCTNGHEVVSKVSGYDIEAKLFLLFGDECVYRYLAYSDVVDLFEENVTCLRCNSIVRYSCFKTATFEQQFAVGSILSSLMTTIVKLKRFQQAYEELQENKKSKKGSK